jgi:phosphomannomutase
MISKIFKAYDVRATYPEPLGPDDAWKVGHASATFLRRSRGNVADDQKVDREDTIVVGRDMRPHSPELAGALIEGIRSTGMNVLDIGMIDTSCIYFAINHYGCVGGIQTTASHNPIDYNGFKISGPLAKPIGAATGLKDIERIAGQLTRAGNTGVTGGLEEADVWPAYTKHVHQFLDLKRPVKIVNDASNGMAGVMIPKVFGDVADLSQEKLNFEIGQGFAHEPNPLVEENLEQVKQAVRGGTYDCGVCFDGDADRCIFVDEQGNTVGCDLLTALIARDFLRQPGNNGSAIVYDLRSSHALKKAIEAAGGRPQRDRVGHVFMKKTMAETKAVFGGELSGHFYFRDNFFADSGAIAFARVLSILSDSDRSLSEMMAEFGGYHQSGELNFKVEDKDGMIRTLADKYKQHEVDYLDGITVDAESSDGWWFNVRKSNTEPMLRLNLEATDAGTRDHMLGELKDLLGEPAAGH